MRVPMATISNSPTRWFARSDPAKRKLFIFTMDEHWFTREKLNRSPRDATSEVGKHFNSAFKNNAFYYFCLYYFWNSICKIKNETPTRLIILIEDAGHWFTRMEPHQNRADLMAEVGENFDWRKIHFTPPVSIKLLFSLSQSSWKKKLKLKREYANKN